MKSPWIIFILGFGLYVFALIPEVLPHRLDVIAMVFSGILVFLAGTVMALSGHAYYLFIVAVPSLDAILLGFQELKKNK